MDLNFSQAVVVQFWLLKKGKSSEFDFQDTGESPRDPQSQQAEHLRLVFLQRNINIYANIYHKTHRGPSSLLTLRIFIFNLFS